MSSVEYRQDGPETIDGGRIVREFSYDEGEDRETSADGKSRLERIGVRVPRRKDMLLIRI